MSAISSGSSVLSSSSSYGTAASTDTLPSSSAQSLTANDFIEFLTTELQNQDPTNPTDSSQMLTQLSEIGQLESSSNLDTSLTNMVQQNNVAAASSMIGKAVTGTDSNSNPLSGTVSSVQVTSNGVNLTLNNGSTMPLSNLSSITSAGSTTATSTSGTGSSTGS